MSDPFLAEIKIVGFNFPPRGWAQCDGQILPINQNQSLYSLLGTTYGGDGRTSFGLPDLRGRVPIHEGGDLSLGARAGEERHTLDITEIPSHAHAIQASSNAASTPLPTGNVLGAFHTGYADGTASISPAHSSGDSEPTGTDLAHENMQPFLSLNFCIALWGIYPARN